MFFPTGILMELFLVAAAIGGVVAVIAMVNQRQKRLADNNRLLEQALQNPAVDRATLENLAYQLTGKRPLRAGGGRGAGMAWILALGWMALFTGIGLFIAAETYGDRDMGVAGWIVGLIGFGFVTYPFALRELDARRVHE